MRNPLANPPVLCARNHRSLACSTRRSFDVRTSLHTFPTESFIAHTADLSALIDINLTKSPSNSVGARPGRSGGEVPYCRPPPSSSVVLSVAPDPAPRPQRPLRPCLITPALC